MCHPRALTWRTVRFVSLAFRSAAKKTVTVHLKIKIINVFFASGCVLRNRNISNRLISKFTKLHSPLSTLWVTFSSVLSFVACWEFPLCSLPSHAGSFIYPLFHRILGISVMLHYFIHIYFYSLSVKFCFIIYYRGAFLLILNINITLCLLLTLSYAQICSECPFSKHNDDGRTGLDLLICLKPFSYVSLYTCTIN